MNLPQLPVFGLPSPFQSSGLTSTSNALSMEPSNEPAGQKRTAEEPLSDAPASKKTCSTATEALGFLEQVLHYSPLSLNLETEADCI